MYVAGGLMKQFNTPGMYLTQISHLSTTAIYKTDSYLRVVIPTVNIR